MSGPPPSKRVRRSVRGSNSIPNLSSTLARPGTLTVIITGAGLSAASGIPTFRGSSSAVWSNNIWTMATREAFRREPSDWWNDFWLTAFPLSYTGYSPNAGHEAIAHIVNNAPGTVKVLTQNVDGLHKKVSDICPHTCEQRGLRCARTRHLRVTGSRWRCLPASTTERAICERGEPARSARKR